MNCAAEDRFNGTKLRNANVLLQDTKKMIPKSEGAPKVNSDELKSSVMELFPWNSEFKKMCRYINMEKDAISLTDLMKFYVRNVSISANECYTRPLRAAKLKDCISETLLLFLYIYREHSEDCDRSVYLEYMSDLLAVYVDMELKASRKSREDHDKICARLTSCLYVYLEHSTEHLLETLMKIQFMCRSYYDILDPIITKVIKNIPTHPESDTMYVCYFLVYRLWRKINEDVAVKNQISTTAIASLGPPPLMFPPCILKDVLPKVPKCQLNSTKVLLQHKFDIKKCCDLFLQSRRKCNGNTPQKMDGDGNTMSLSNRVISNTLEDIANKSIEHIDNANSIVSDKSKQNESISLLSTFKSSNLEEQASLKCLGTFSNNVSTKRITSESMKLGKNISRKKLKKSNKIVIIDLTSDVALEKCIKKRKSRKVPWLEEATKRINLKTTRAPEKMKKKVEEANGCLYSLNNLKNVNHRVNSTVFPTIAKNETDDSKTVNTKNDTMEHDSTDVFIDSKVNFDDKEKSKTEKLCGVSSSFVLPTDRTVSDFSNGHTNNSKNPSNSDVKEESGDNVSDKRNEQAVIKRLIDANVSLNSETSERAESLKKICDLKTGLPDSVNDINTLHNSKDAGNNNYKAIIHKRGSEEITSSITVLESEENAPGKSVEVLDSVSVSKNVLIVEKINKIDRETKSGASIIIANGKDKNGSITPMNIFANKKTSTHVENMILYMDRRQSCKSGQNSTCATLSGSVERPELSKDLATQSENLDIVKTKDFGGSQNFKVENYMDTLKEVNDDVSNNADVKESIFEPYSTEKRDTFSEIKLPTCPVEQMKNKEQKGCTNSEKSIENVTRANYKNEPSKILATSYGDKNGMEIEKHSTLQDNTHKDLSNNSNEMSDLVFDNNAKNNLERTLKNEPNTDKILESKCVIQDNELQDSIDGLSLLASVSQHVPHLKAESKVKCDQIKVKDYASLRNMSYNGITDDETDTNESSNSISQLLENPSTEIINRIVGVYPDDGIDKVALHVEVSSSNEVDISNSENGLCCATAHESDINIHYDGDSSQGLISAESNVQTVKENTNVILNGETVVLLQKSPNSNLYIINKAVENSKDHGNDDELNKLKEKAWLSPLEDCGQYEVVASSDHGSFNLELSQYNGESSCQENKFIIGRNKGIKVEPEENFSNLSDVKSYSRKVPISIDTLPVASQIYQDVSTSSININMNINKPVDKRKPKKSNLTFRQNIKQECNGISSHITSNCTMQGYNGLHSHTHEVESQHPLHIPVTHPTTLPSLYGNCAANTDLCVPYHKHCTSVSCSLQINATTSLHSHTTKANNSCGRPRCSCLKCTYDIVTHCRQCIHPTTDTHVSCVESNPYYLPTHSSVQTSAVQEHDRTKNEQVVGKLYDDQLLCKMEKDLLQNHSLEKLEVQRESEKLFEKNMDIKLPLKKRLKAHAMMSTTYDKMPIKAESLGNYPGVPMMSIAALEALDSTQKQHSSIITSSYALPPNKKDDSRTNYHCNSNLVRRDYYKDVHVASSHHSITKESTRKHERQFRSLNDQPSDTMCQESCSQRMFKTPAQRKEVTTSNVTTSVKKFEAELEVEGVPYKKAKKTQLPLRQTRSSKRNVPKVNYCYTDVDPEWNPSGESRRKRKKASR